MSLVPTVGTHPTKVDFARALRAVAPELNKGQAGILWAHFALETTDGTHCYGWNLGNVKWNGTGDYQVLHGVFEYVHGVRVEVPPDSPGAWFRAFASLEDGMRYFVNMKREPGWRYSSAWPFVLAADPEGYAAELKNRGYYTAPLKTYQDLMRTKFFEWLNSPAWDANEDEVPTPRVNPLPILPLLDSMDRTIVDPGDLVPVELDGATWLVAPVVVAPISIGGAVKLAKDSGFELPTPALADAIWRAADLRVPPHLMVRTTDGVHMNTPELNAQEQQALADYIGARALGVDYKLLAGAFKDVVVGPDGHPGIYGWHADHDAAVKLAVKGIAAHPCATDGEGVVVQPPYYKHAPEWVDYSQGARLVRRAG